jgi:hypothetical protein
VGPFRRFLSVLASLMGAAGLSVTALAGVVSRGRHVGVGKSSLDEPVEPSSSEPGGLNDSRSRRRQIHDARNTLTAVEGTAITLARYHESLAPSDREKLVEGLRSEIARLQGYLIPVEPSKDADPGPSHVPPGSWSRR